MKSTDFRSILQICLNRKWICSCSIVFFARLLLVFLCFRDFSVLKSLPPLFAHFYECLCGSRSFAFVHRVDLSAAHGGGGGGGGARREWAAAAAAGAGEGDREEEEDRDRDHSESSSRGGGGTPHAHAHAHAHAGSSSHSSSYNNSSGSTGTGALSSLKSFKAIFSRAVISAGKRRIPTSAKHSTAAAGAGTSGGTAGAGGTGGTGGTGGESEPVVAHIPRHQAPPLQQPKHSSGGSGGSKQDKKDEEAARLAQQRADDEEAQKYLFAKGAKPPPPPMGAGGEDTPSYPVSNTRSFNSLIIILFYPCPCIFLTVFCLPCFLFSFFFFTSF
jgi:hypothetical protein